MKPAQLTLNYLSVDDCALVGKLIHHPRLATAAQGVLFCLNRWAPNTAGRSRQIRELDYLFQLAERYGFDVVPPRYPHEMCAAWLTWLKSTDMDRYDAVLVDHGWSDLLAYGRPKTDIDGAERSLELITYGAKGWLSLLRGYAGTDIQRYHRDLMARVHPETSQWSDLELTDVRGATLGLLWVVN